MSHNNMAEEMIMKPHIKKMEKRRHFGPSWTINDPGRIQSWSFLHFVTCGLVIKTFTTYIYVVITPFATSIGKCISLDKLYCFPVCNVLGIKY